MESRKRKASSAQSPPTEGSASKKLRLLNSSAAPRNSVQEVGNRVVQQLKGATDKTGRLIAIEFLELPDRDEIPEYYEFIKLPVALETIEAKLKQNEYPTVTTIESDFKRLVQNAKDFNDPGSLIYEDAERIRKLVFNFMKQNNPAYKENPNYSAFPTPIPQPLIIPLQNGKREVESEDEPRPKSRQASERPKRAATEQSDRKSSAAPSATDPDADGDDDDEAMDVDLDFTGKTFQEAQQLIINYLLHYTDDGVEIYSVFANLVSRKLEDYYKVIRHPVCLKGIMKRTKGIHGRAPPTGQTDFKTWDAFEAEMSFIWRNAKVYNEDESDMYRLAGEFEEHVKSILAEAREKVDEPSGPKIKLGGLKPKVTLSLSQPRHSPAPTPGVAIDNESLARQRQMVQAGASGQTSAPPVNPLIRAESDGARPSSSARSGSPAVAAVKSEHPSIQSPAPVQAPPHVQPHQPYTNGVMAPPIVRPLNGSPYPLQPPATSYHYTVPAMLPPTPIRPYPREASILPSVTITTHPNLKLPHPISLTITPHPTLSHQSTTTTLPAAHYFLQIAATISKQLSMGRAYKMFVSINGTRLTQRDTQLHPDSHRRTHVYEGSLAHGVNRVEVEVATARENDEKGLNVEKVTVFANLTR